MVADENWVTFTVRYVSEYTLQRGTKDRLFQLILGKFEEHADQIEIATAAFAITELPKIQTRLDAGQ